MNQIIGEWRRALGIGGATAVRRGQLAGLMWPLACMFVVAIAIGVALLAALVVRMDQQAAAQTRLMMNGALETRTSALATMTRDYGRWDDAVLKLYGEVDRDWAFNNLSNATHVILFDQASRTLFSVGPDGSDGVTASEAMPSGLAELLRRLPKSSEKAHLMETGVSIVTRFDGAPAIVSAMPIIPYSDQLRQPDKPLRYIALTQAIDAQLLQEWQASFGLSHVQLKPSVPPRLEPHSIALGSTAERVGFITWDPVHPGRAAARSISPYLLSCFALLGVACFMVARRVIGVARELANQTALAGREAAIAAANLEIARQAQMRAEAAQMRAETLAAQANLARREAALRLASREREPQASDDAASEAP